MSHGRRLQWRAMIAACLQLVLGAACRPSMPAAYERQVQLASRAVEDQEYAAAADHWAAAAELAETPNDRHEAIFRQASNLRKAGDETSYWALLRGLASSQGPRQARAAYELARRDYESSPTTNRAALRRVLLSFRHSAHATAALDLLLSAQSAPERYASLARLEPQVSDAAALHEYVLILQARTAEQLGKDATAVKLYQKASQSYPYPVGRYWDKALLREALLRSRQGDNQTAVKRLEHMVSYQERALLFGTYVRLYAPARLLWARLLIAEDWRASHRLLVEVAVADDESRLLDDALWTAALLAKEQSATGMACQDADMLRDLRPQSRYVPCLSLVCPTFGADSSCRGYVKDERSDARAMLDLTLEPFLAGP